MEESNNIIRKGSILLAEPLLNDNTFDRTVIVLTEHNEEGSVGFVINKPLEVNVSDAVNYLKADEHQLYYGGPVQQDNLYFIHSIPDLLPGSIQFTETLYWGGDIEVLKALLERGDVTKKEIRFFLGYSGWAKEQLNSEIQSKSWVVLNDSSIDIIKSNSKTIWREALLEQGGKYKIWANSPSNPMLN